VDSHSSKIGLFRAQHYETGSKKFRLGPETEAFEELRKKWAADSAAMSHEFDSLKKQTTELNERLSGAIETEVAAAKNRGTKFDQFVTAQGQELSAQRQKGKEDLDKLTETYDQFMKLKAPVAYWRAKHKHHLKARNWFAALTVGIGGVAFLWLWSYVETNFHTGAKDQIPWREIVGFIVLSSIVFWVVRILVRLLLSAIHLAEDASERAVMAETYMALVRGDESKAKYLDEKDRALVLAPLFRPSATGIVTDDAAPAQLAELLTKIGGKK
jgi:hypothetical protein